MLGLELLPVGLNDIAGHSTPDKHKHWLLSVFSGIIMCKIVYDITGSLSQLLVERYANLKKKEKLEWNNRGFSSFHAVIVAAASLYLLTVSDLFDDDPGKELIINRSSTLSDTLLGISIGYFISDLSMIIYYFPDLGGLEYILHHGLSLFSIIQSLLSGQGQMYILMVLFSESTTPCVNLRWYLDVAGQKKSKAYVCNGVALFFWWLVARVLLFVYFFYHMYTHFDQVKEVYPLGFYSLITVPPVLAMMNLLWFWKIARGLIRTLTRKGHKK